MENLQEQQGGKLWYKEGLQFECQQCGNCCRGEPGLVKIDNRDIIRISSYLRIKKEIFAKQYLRIVDGNLSLKEFRNGDCIMYDNGCKIYSKRPLQCRTFPFWRSNLKKKPDWNKQKRTCPGIDKGRLYTYEEIEKNLGPALMDY